MTDDYIVIDEGPLGTTCARAGCMPSKTLIQIANEYHRRRRWKELGIDGGRKLVLNIPEALAHVRKLRDHFAGEVARSTKRLGSRLVRGRALMIGANVLRVGRKEFFARRVILATGSRPVVPKEFLDLGPRVVTSDSLFELEDLPPRVGVVGIGSIGLEIGQTLSRLGCDVAVFDRSGVVGELSDPKINSYAIRHFSKEFPLHLKREVTLKSHSKKIVMRARGRTYEQDLILASLGRRPNLDRLGLEMTGAILDDRGVPPFDPQTMKLTGLPIFIAGDASAYRAILHEASDDGWIAGYNSVHPRTRCFKRRVPIAITFSEPNLVLVGKRFRELKRERFVTGEASFETQGRALITGENYGLLHVYIDAVGGEFLGAEMIGPSGEHLAHLMSWALQQRLTVFEMLGMPFYHPTMEEGLRTALLDAEGKLPSSSRSASRSKHRDLAIPL